MTTTMTLATVRTENGKPIESKRDYKIRTGCTGSQAAAAIRAAWEASGVKACEMASIELPRAQRAGHKVMRKVSKTGAISYTVSAKPMAALKPTAAKDKEIAELKAKLAAFEAAAAKSE